VHRESIPLARQENSATTLTWKGMDSISSVECRQIRGILLPDRF